MADWHLLDHSPSYTMDLEEKTKISDSDSVIDDESNGFTIVCDPKSLLYLFGAQPRPIRSHGACGAA
jgi:hypothetical protein